MEKLFKNWIAILGVTGVLSVFSFFKKAIPVGQCIVEKCADQADRWPAVLAMTFAVLLALLALWMRGSGALLKTRKAEEALQSLTKDTQVIMDAFDIRIVGAHVEFGENHSLLIVKDAAVVMAVSRLRKQSA